MKLPLWAKSKEGVWEIFPYHLLDTYEDGKQGFTFECKDDNLSEKTQAFLRFRHYFEYIVSPAGVGWVTPNRKPVVGFRYYLKEKP